MRLTVAARSARAVGLAAVPVVVPVVVLGLGLAGCGGDGGSASKADTAGVTAHIKVFSFRPDPLKVKAGTAVTWINDDDIAHTVTSGTREYAPGDTGKIVATKKDGLFDNALDGQGKKAAFTFTKAGAFHYFCDRHPGMESDVIVE
jgi:plastocyanin